MVAEVKPNRALLSARLFQSWLNRLGPVLGLALVIGIFSILMDTPARFLSPNNLRIVLSQTVIVAVGAIGMTLIIISGGIDLAVGSTIALTGVITALGIHAGLTPVVALAAGIFVGGLIGVVNGLVITRLKVVPFIATLGMLGVARGTAKWVAGQQTVNMPDTWLNELLVMFPNPAWLLVAPGVWVTVVLAICAAIVLRNTVFGRRVFALGSNEAAARACGIATDRLKIWIYGLAGPLFRPARMTEMVPLPQGQRPVPPRRERYLITSPVLCGGRRSSCASAVSGVSEASRVCSA